MQYRPLGDSGLNASALALGGWAFGATPETWGYVDDNESIAAIHEALDCGITLIDTAPIYGLGHSEEIIGKALRGRRDEVVLATKCGLAFPTSKKEPPRRCLAPESIMQECEASLRRLGTEVIDLYLCHWPDPATPIEATISALLTLRKQGKIKALGLSNFSVEQTAEARACGPVHALQPPFSALLPRVGADLIPYCLEHGIAVLPYSPLAKGLLTGKFSADTEFTDVRSRDPDFVGARYQRNLAVVRKLAAIAQQYEKTVGQLALNWLMDYPGVTAPIFGAKKPSQVRENAAAADWALSTEDRARIDLIVKET